MAIFRTSRTMSIMGLSCRDEGAPVAPTSAGAPGRRRRPRAGRAGRDRGAAHESLSKTQLGGADLDPVAGLQDDLGDGAPVHARAVRRAEVAQDDLGAGETHLGVLPRDVRVGEHDVAAPAATDDDDRVGELEVDALAAERVARRRRGGALVEHRLRRGRAGRRPATHRPARRRAATAPAAAPGSAPARRAGRRRRRRPPAARHRARRDAELAGAQVVVGDAGRCAARRPSSSPRDGRTRSGSWRARS